MVCLLVLYALCVADLFPSIQMHPPTYRVHATMLPDDTRLTTYRMPEAKHLTARVPIHLTVCLTVHLTVHLTYAPGYMCRSHEAIPVTSIPAVTPDYMPCPTTGAQLRVAELAAHCTPPRI